MFAALEVNKYWSGVSEGSEGRVQLAGEPQGRGRGRQPQLSDLSTS